MPRSQLKILVALVMVLTIGGIGAFALSRPQPQIATIPTGAVVQAEPSSTPTETKISATTSGIMTVSPTFRFVKTLHPTSVPNATNVIIQVSSNATFIPLNTLLPIVTRTGPTLTPSGPLVELTETTMKKLKDTFPEQLGGIKFEINKDTSIGQLVAGHANDDLSQFLLVRISISDSAHTSDTFFTSMTRAGELSNYEHLKIGDEAIITLDRRNLLGLMRWRNCIIKLVVDSPTGYFEPRLTGEQVVQIFEDVVAFLDQNNPTSTPTPHTPADQPLGGSLEEVRRIMANAPKTVGGLPLTTNPKTTDDLTPVISILNTDGTRYYITLSFGNSGKDFEQRIGRIKQFATSFRTIDLADETLLFKGSSVLILMRYRNVLVPLERPDPRPSAVGPTPVPLTDDQLIAIMTDLYTYLSQQ